MTSSIGIYQHGKLNKPDPEFGYALEDQARALMVVDEFKDKNLKNIYLNFIIKAQREDGLLYHFYYENNGKGVFKDKEYNLKSNSEEAYGLTLWSLLATKSNQNDDIKKMIKNLIEDAHDWTSIRAISAALLGLLNLDYQHSLENELKAKLHNFYFETYSDDWRWFENYLVYANAIIPWALWEIYLKRKCKISFEIARETTDFLMKNCQENNIPSPIGNKGWYLKGKNKALFDQQPIDASYMVCCLEKAYYATEDNFYLNLSCSKSLIKTIMVSTFIIVAAFVILFLSQQIGTRNNVESSMSLTGIVLVFMYIVIIILSTGAPKGSFTFSLNLRSLIPIS